MTNKERQKNLDKKKWAESEKEGRDMSGEMPYCWHCPKCILGIDKYNTCTATQEQRETNCLCARAFNRMRNKKLTK